MVEAIEGVLETISGYLWGSSLFGTSLLVPLLLITGIVLTVVLRGIQFTRLREALHLAFIQRRERTSEGDVSHYRALTTALSGTVGTGNIAGVATAIFLGGPGALFWMWITALFGMATKYAEAVLGVKYRETDRAGEKAGGPMFFLSRGIGGPVGKTLGTLFAVFAAIAAFGIGNTVQGYETSSALEGAFGIPPLVTASVLTVGAGAIILGGIRRIGAFTAYVVPIMIFFYMLAAAIILVINFTAIPAAIGTVVVGAFAGEAVGGATIGLALQYGIARGIFSNESGLGTGGIAAASAQTTSPVRQGIVSMTQTFIDTIVVCSFTGLAIVTSGVWREGGEFGDSGAEMTQAAFGETLGPIGPTLVAVAIALFAFSTLITWAYYGERNIVYLIGRKGVMPYRILFVAVIFVGASAQLGLVWAFADAANAAMALPNLIGLLLLAGVVARETRNHFSGRRASTVSGAETGEESAEPPRVR